MGEPNAKSDSRVNSPLSGLFLKNENLFEAKKSFFVPKTFLMTNC
jgi:hypothetical protein